jgi:hypothetical protein
VILDDRTKALREKLFDIDAKVSEITKEAKIAKESWHPLYILPTKFALLVT